MVYLCVMNNFSQQYKIMSWNVRGLNSRAKQEDVMQMVGIYRPDIVCVQEPKMERINEATVRNSLGRDYDGDFKYLPADGTRGGILVASRTELLKLEDCSLTTNTISLKIQDGRRNITWGLTVAYGPQEEFDKKMFIRELKQLKTTAHRNWLLIGDFNLIYRDEDKNNG